MWIQLLALTKCGKTEILGKSWHDQKFKSLGKKVNNQFFKINLRHNQTELLKSENLVVTGWHCLWPFQSGYYTLLM